tara:strand:- start:726 stop:1178 length:453 start_codon:yes stop_codon:yes gene_type:complete
MGNIDSIQRLRKKRITLELPLASEHVSAGFPSPADDYIDIGIDLNEQLIRNPSSTFFLRVSGYSMTNAGINHGDLLIVDRSLDPKPGKIVVAIIDGSFTLKRLTYNSNKLYLEAAHPDYPSIDISQYESIQIWGVAIYSIHQLTTITTPL